MQLNQNQKPQLRTQDGTFIYSEIHEQQFDFEHSNRRNIFFSGCNLFFNEFKEREFFISSDKEFHICGRTT